jgi:hypothetical protein
MDTIMAARFDSHNLVTLEELPISNVWEISVIVEVLEWKGLLP